MKAHLYQQIVRLVFVGLFSFLILVPNFTQVNAAPVPPLPPEQEKAETPDALYGSLLNSIYKTADKSGYQTGATGDTLGDTISAVTTAFIGFLGVIATLLIIYAGFLWMTAGGDEGKIDKSKSVIKQVVVGFVVLSLAYAIIAYVFYAVTIAGSGEVK